MNLSRVLLVLGLLLGACATFAQAQTFYVSVYDGYNVQGSVLKVAEDGSNAPLVTTFATGFEQPEGLVFDQSGNLYVLDGYTIYKYNAAGQQSVFVNTTPGTGNIYVYGQPQSGLAIDSQGNIYVPGTDNSTGSYSSVILKYSPGGTLLHIYSTPGLASGMVVDANDNLYVAQSFSGVISKFAPDGTETTYSADPNLGTPAGLALDNSGTLYVSTDNKVYIVNSDGTLTPYVTTIRRNLFTSGMAFDASGNLLTAVDDSLGSGSRNALYLTTTDGTTSSYVSLGQYQLPNAIAYSPVTAPEPGPTALFFCGLGALAFFRLRRAARR